MSNDTVVSLAAPARVCDPLTELLRTGARRLVEAAVTAEFEEYLSGFVQEKLPDGRQRVVRNGHLPERKILTGLGEVDVRVPYYTQGRRSFFRLHEKGGRYNVVPAHHTAQEYVDAYLEAARIGEDRRGSLFRSCEPGRRDVLQERGMSRMSAFKMIKRRARKAGLPAEICAHSFRGTGITEYLRNGGDLKVAARIAGHESTRTTQIYNRLREEISLDEIERIHI